MPPKDVIPAGAKREFGTWDFEQWTHRRSLKVGPDILTADSAPCETGSKKTKKQARGSDAAARRNISTLRNTRTKPPGSGCNHSQVPTKPSDPSPIGNTGDASSTHKHPSAQIGEDEARCQQCGLSCGHTTTKSVQGSDVGSWIDVGEGNEFEFVDKNT